MLLLGRAQSIEIQGDMHARARDARDETDEYGNENENGTTRNEIQKPESEQKTNRNENRNRARRKEGRERAAAAGGGGERGGGDGDGDGGNGASSAPKRFVGKDISNHTLFPSEISLLNRIGNLP